MNRHGLFYCVQSKEMSVQKILELLSDLGLPKQEAKNKIFIKV